MDHKFGHHSAANTDTFSYNFRLQSRILNVFIEYMMPFKMAVEISWNRAAFSILKILKTALWSLVAFPVFKVLKTDSIGHQCNRKWHGWLLWDQRLTYTPSLLHWSCNILWHWRCKVCHHVNILVQKKLNSSVLAMELCLSCTNPCMWFHIYRTRWAPSCHVLWSHMVLLAHNVLKAKVI